VLRWGMRTKTWTGLCRQSETLCRQSETLSIFDRAERAQRDLDPLLVVPADVGVHGFNELLKGRGLPVPRIEQFRFQPPEEAFADCVVRRAPFARHRADQVRATDS